MILFVAIDHPESVFGLCRNKGKRPRQCWLFTLDNAPSCVPVDHYSAYFYLVPFFVFVINVTQHITHDQKQFLNLVQAGVGKVNFSYEFTLLE